MAKPETTKPPAARAEAPKTDAKQRAISPLIVARWSEAQFKQARHAISPEANTDYLNLFDPAYFSHIAPKVNANDIIEVRPPEGTYYAELYVWAKGPNWLQVSEIVRIERPTTVALPSISKAFSIDFVDGPAKHRVIRNSDSQVMAQHFESIEGANSWLAQNANRIAA